MSTTRCRPHPGADAPPTITITDGVERPAPGRWAIPPTTLDATIGTRLNRRRTQLRVQGTLDVASSGPVVLALATTNARRHPGAGFRYHGVLTGADRFGRWRFEGTARCYDSTYRLAVDARYMGVFDRHDPACWIELHDSRVVTEPTARRHRIIRTLGGHLSASGRQSVTNRIDHTDDHTDDHAGTSR